MASRAWSQREMAVMERNIDRRNWLEDVAAALPHRSEGSLTSKMQVLRQRHGFDAVDHGWVRDARDATRRLLEATLRVGTWQ